MTGVKTLVSIVAFALLGACSTVKLNDKAAPVEDRNTSAPRQHLHLHLHRVLRNPVATPVIRAQALSIR